MDVNFLIRSFYLLSSAAILFIYSFPPFKRRFLAYGARAQSSKPGEQYCKDCCEKSPAVIRMIEEEAHAEAIDARLNQNGLLDKFAAITVPHSWFWQFYLFSLLSGIFWAHQIWTHGSVFAFVTRQIDSWPGCRPSADQATTAWSLIMMQAFRRLAECIPEPGHKKSQSRMFIGHWIIGLAFYAVTNVAIWTEVDPTDLEALASRWRAWYKTTRFPYTPNLTKTEHMQTANGTYFMSGVTLWFVGYFSQTIVHFYLSSLRSKGYSMPKHWAFKYTLTPHYFFECVEYLGLALFMARAGQLFSTNMLCCLIFVVVNLGVTADGTRNWYEQKFGAAAIRGKSRMIPGIW